MEKEEIKNKIEKLTEELNKIVALRDLSENEEESHALTLKDFEISRQIDKLDWQLKNSDEKQEYRRMMVNVSKKWGGMGQPLPYVHQKISLEYYVEMYDLAQELLQKKDIPERIINVLKELIEQIDLEF